ncbi:hypothetical protein Tco_0702749 [Tanacetum coccineum]|uniref:Reverse transcriptase domain-containing protein n=1 Tax=Tanacetum coccineum TaxID=301880 RepID=A0ABQ4XYI1_9ASTR
MEVFSLIMENKIEESNEFGYHFGCKDLKLSHMCFADDLLVLCKGNEGSIEVVKKSLEEFSHCGRLLVRYLGVPLLAKKLWFGNCMVLIDKVEERINNWRNKTLSYARRIQLIASVLASMQMYWASVYLLPTTVIKDLEKLDGPLSTVISRRDIYDARLDDNAKVADMLHNDQWVWHDGWKEKYTILSNLDGAVNLSNKEDKVLWVTNAEKK